MVSDEVRKAIDKVNRRFSEGFHQGDASITASVYMEDAVICPPNSEMIRGRKAIEKFWSGVMKMGAKEAELTTVELSGSGNTLHELGNGLLKIHPEGQEPVEQRVKYVVVWKLTADGWKYQWDIWNSN
ncbi:MAG: YybH family protein [Candidatus Thorarchaeota archaeon]|jgi:uncharacterized protein (TIGR02246 family)